jgi:hypothetical protein
MVTGIERLVGEVAIGAVEAGDAGAIIGMIVTVRAAVMEIEIATATGAAETVAIKNAAIGTAIGTRVTGNCVRAMGRSFGERPFCRIAESPTAVAESRTSGVGACGRNEGEGAQMVSTILDRARPSRDQFSSQANPEGRLRSLPSKAVASEQHPL